MRRRDTRKPGRPMTAKKSIPTHTHMSDEWKLHALGKQCARTVDANGGVVLDSEINVLLNTETEVASVAEVVAVELVLLDLVCQAYVRK